MPLLTNEQIETARSVDLLSYLQAHEPQELVRKGSRYIMASHDSLVIENGKWFRFSTDVGGHSALDFLIKVRGMDFVDAVNHLAGGAVTYSPPKPPPKVVQDTPKRPFTLPAANVNNDRVIAYLRGRGLSAVVIKRCIGNGSLYESAKGHNAVFIGFDGEKPRFACERGTMDGFKKDVAGSDKRFGFVLPPNGAEISKLAVFESAIDSLAHHDVHAMGKTGWDGYRLSLGGVSPLALISFLEQRPQIASVQLCLDNDKAGKEAADRIVKRLLSDKRFAHIKITITPPPLGKDYGDTLQGIHQLNKQKAIESRHDKAAFSV